MAAEEGRVELDATSTTLGGAEAAGVLHVANTLSLAQLDVDVGLDRRAAERIVVARDVQGDFASIGELDAVPWVGQTALDLLLDYARAHGMIDGEEPPEACLLISEYVEGSGGNNKAIEVWNCGDHLLPLGTRSLCLVRNDDHACSVEANFSNVDLGPGETWVVCRTTGGTFNDPLQSLRDRCDQEMPGVVNMSGDDRLAILDGDGSVLDAFGTLASRPASPLWADVALRRCDLEPFDGTGTFTTEGRFTRHARNTHQGLGVAPTEGCD
jgi:hypothetical protein